MNDLEAFQIGAAIVRLNKLVFSGFIDKPEKTDNIYYSSVIIEILIKLDFLLFTAHEKNVSVDFTEDIPIYKESNRDNGGYKDIISLVHFFRNAACHEKASKRKTGEKPLEWIAFVYQAGSTPEKNS